MDIKSEDPGEGVNVSKGIMRVGRGGLPEGGGLTAEGRVLWSEKRVPRQGKQHKQRHECGLMGAVIIYSLFIIPDLGAGAAPM